MSEHPRTAAEKIRQALDEIAEPDPDAEQLELAMASIATMAAPLLGPQLESKQQDGSLDSFLRGLAMWVASLRSDDARPLLVVELPRSPDARQLPAGTRLHCLDEAEKAAQKVESPL